MHDFRGEGINFREVIAIDIWVIQIIWRIKNDRAIVIFRIIETIWLRIIDVKVINIRLNWWQRVRLNLIKGFTRVKITFYMLLGRKVKMWSVLSRPKMRLSICSHYSSNIDLYLFVNLKDIECVLISLSSLFLGFKKKRQ